MLHLLPVIMKMEQIASLPDALTVLWQGMLGIFIVALFIILFTVFLNAVTKKEAEEE